MGIRLERYLIAALFLACFSQVGLAEEESCDVRLFKEAVRVGVQTEDYYFFLSQIDRTEYDKNQNDYAALIPGYFAGSYDKFTEKLKKLKESLQITVDNRYSLQYALDRLDSNGLDAYNNCLKAKRRESELDIYAAKGLSENEQVSFVVDLKSDFDLAGPTIIDVYHSIKLLSSIDPSEKVKQEGDITHIAISNLRAGKPFTVRRVSNRKPVQITAHIGGLVAPALEFGPVLKKVVKDVDGDAYASHTITYLARRLGDGSNDFVWAADGISGSNNNASGDFRANACLCASGQIKTFSDNGYGVAGTCEPAPDNEAKVLPPVKLEPGFLFTGYTCAGQPQRSPVLSASNASAVCFEIPMSLNAPDQWNSNKACTVTWTISGRVRRKVVIFQIQ